MSCQLARDHVTANDSLWLEVPALRAWGNERGIQYLSGDLKFSLFNRPQTRDKQRKSELRQRCLKPVYRRINVTCSVALNRATTGHPSFLVQLVEYMFLFCNHLLSPCFHYRGNIYKQGSFFFSSFSEFGTGSRHSEEAAALRSSLSFTFQRLRLLRFCSLWCSWICYIC